MNKLPLYLIPVSVAIFIQLIKVIIDYMLDRRIHLEYIWRAGGFPSVHSGISSSICLLVFLKQGIYSIEFAICITFSIMFWYDAMNVRREAGKHAKYINDLSISLGDILQIKNNYNILKERLGHTIEEVFGGIAVGMIITYLIIRLFPQFGIRLF